MCEVYMKTTILAPLEHEPRQALPTNEAARHLSLKPQTLRAWAHYWPVGELLRVLQEGSAVAAGGAE